MISLRSLETAGLIHKLHAYTPTHTVIEAELINHWWWLTIYKQFLQEMQLKVPLKLKWVQLTKLMDDVRYAVVLSSIECELCCNA